MRASPRTIGKRIGGLFTAAVTIFALCAFLAGGPNSPWLAIGIGIAVVAVSLIVLVDWRDRDESYAVRRVPDELADHPQPGNLFRIDGP